MIIPIEYTTKGLKPILLHGFLAARQYQCLTEGHPEESHDDKPLSVCNYCFAPILKNAFKGGVYSYSLMLSLAMTLQFIREFEKYKHVPFMSGGGGGSVVLAAGPGVVAVDNKGDERSIK